ncbi:hypothetical protein AJ80_05999 [Polytolypa hystricis UAMH7299]|uniref:ARID domain-containing protein n=1 Tax=Polytolypa hystricis (strain UAMH7299) TaxID=1447883 RepID=A0A2B7XZB5_POLH7|nr:hypothetical protein AJ80_05999 [Polytolypa hystricis UAMH7299]
MDFDDLEFLAWGASLAQQLQQHFSYPDFPPYPQIPASEPPLEQAYGQHPIQEELAQAGLTGPPLEAIEAEQHCENEDPEDPEDQDRPQDQESLEEDKPAEDEEPAENEAPGAFQHALKLVENPSHFWTRLQNFYKAKGILQSALPTTPNSLWNFGPHKKINPHKLFLAVLSFGGRNLVSTDKKNWRAIGRDLGLSESHSETFSWHIRRLYSDHLFDFERSFTSNFDMQNDATPDASGTRSSNTTTPNAPSNASPNPAAVQNASFNMNSTPVNMAGAPMQTIQADTPSNRRGKFSKPEARAANPVDPIMSSLISEAMPVPSIYIRCLRGLESPLEEEQAFATHHLVAISDERGDKLKLAEFPSLAEHLVEVVLEKVGLLLYGKPWEVNWDGEPYSGLADNQIDGAYGTKNLLVRIQKRDIIFRNDGLMTARDDTLLRIASEAALTLRNLCTLDGNAHYVSDMEVVWDMLVILMHLPRNTVFDELINYALETVEMVCSWWDYKELGAVTQTLEKFLGSRDKHHCLTALRALVMFSMELPEGKDLGRLPIDKVRWLYQILQVADIDYELGSSTLDFLYQFTLVADNVRLLTEISYPAHEGVDLSVDWLPTLIRLLQVDVTVRTEEVVDQEEQRLPPPTAIPVVPAEVLDRDIEIFQEPERCSRWLRSCFVEDKDCEVTQIALWQAYQACFLIGRPDAGSILPAAEFINTVSKTFATAHAQVVSRETPKFVIQGIRPLEQPRDAEGYPWFSCDWEFPSADPEKPAYCANAYKDPVKLRDHVLHEHLGLPRNPDTGRTEYPQAETPGYKCCWKNCTEHTVPHTNSSLIAGHVARHLPTPRDLSHPPPIEQRKIIKPRVARVYKFETTPVDEKGEPFGIAYKAALILRNILDNLPQEPIYHRDEPHSWSWYVFSTRRDQLVELGILNTSLRGILFDVVNGIETS